MVNWHRVLHESDCIVLPCMVLILQLEDPPIPYGNSTDVIAYSGYVTVCCIMVQ